MEIIYNQIEPGILGVSVQFSSEEVLPEETKRLNAQRHRAAMNGFRPGKVPMGLIRRTYGVSVRYDILNEFARNAIDKVFEEKHQEYRFFGTPSVVDAKGVEEIGAGFGIDLHFAYARIAPFTIGKDDVFTYYQIVPDDEQIARAREYMLRSAGSMQPVDTVAEDSTLEVDFTQGEETVPGATVLVSKIAEKVRGGFIGAHVGDSFDVDVNEAFENASDRAAMLKTTKEALADKDPHYTMTIVNIKNWIAAVPCQETYDKIFGEGKVNSDEEFEQAASVYAAGPYQEQADRYFSQLVVDHFVRKAEVAVPEDFFRSIVKEHVGDKVKSDEELEQTVTRELNSFKWQLVAEAVLDMFAASVVKEDLENAVRSEFAKYGMSPDMVPQDMVDEQLDKEDMQDHYNSVATENKAMRIIFDNITRETKQVSLDEFYASISPSEPVNEDDDEAAVTADEAGTEAPEQE